MNNKYNEIRTLFNYIVQNCVIHNDFKYIDNGILFNYILLSTKTRIINYLKYLNIDNYFEFINKGYTTHFLLKKEYQTKKAKNNIITLLKLKGML